MIAWITLNEAGVVRAASLVGFTSPNTLKEWQDAGRTPMLVDFGEAPVAINKPLPGGVNILQHGAFEGAL